MRQVHCRWTASTLSFCLFCVEKVAHIINNWPSSFKVNRSPSNVDVTRFHKRQTTLYSIRTNEWRDRIRQSAISCRPSRPCILSSLNKITRSSFNILSSVLSSNFFASSQSSYMCSALYEYFDYFHNAWESIGISILFV